jgi:hypothetical protein
LTTSLQPRVWVPRHVARLVSRIVARLIVDYFTYTVRLGASARRAAHRLSSTTSPTPRGRVPRHVARLVVWLVAPLVVDYSALRRLVVNYFASNARPGASTRRAARLADRRTTRRRLLRLRLASGCLGSSCSSSLVVNYFAYAARPGASARRAAHRLSSTTSPTLRDRVPQHVAWLVAPLVVDYSASRRLVVDYFACAARSDASIHRAARLADRRAARCRLLRLRRASGCLGTSCGSSLVIDYFAYATRLGASACLVARPVARCAPRRRLLRLAQARRRLLHFRRASGCLGTSRGSSRRSSRGLSSTISTTPRVWVPRHVARLIACHQLLRLRRTAGCLGTSRG